MFFESFDITMVSRKNLEGVGPRGAHSKFSMGGIAQNFEIGNAPFENLTGGKAPVDEGQKNFVAHWAPQK